MFRQRFLNFIIVFAAIFILVGISYTGWRISQSEPPLNQSLENGGLRTQSEKEREPLAPVNQPVPTATPKEFTSEDVTSIPEGGISVEEDLRVQRISEPRVQLSKTVIPETIEPGGTVVYEIMMLNRDAGDAKGVTITDTLPPGFSYQPGSATLSAQGFLGFNSTSQIADPSIDGQRLTWTNGFTVDAESILTLSFRVTASTNPGTYSNSVSGSSTNGIVISTGDTAPITVQTP